jgi:hypothetical protein
MPKAHSTDSLQDLSTFRKASDHPCGIVSSIVDLRGIEDLPVAWRRVSSDNEDTALTICSHSHANLGGAMPHALSCGSVSHVPRPRLEHLL